MNYYDEILTELKKLIKEENFEQALKIINEELTVPYVPKEFETALIQEKTVLVAKLIGDETQKPDPKKIFQVLEKKEIALEEKLGIAEQLNEVNLRNYLQEITEILNASVGNELKTVLIYLLAEQKIDHEFHYSNGLTSVTLNPTNFDFFQAEEMPLNLLKKLEEILPEDYPQLMHSARSVVANLYYQLFPEGRNYDQTAMSEAIKNRLLSAHGIPFQKLENDQILSYETLLKNLKII